MCVGFRHTLVPILTNSHLQRRTPPTPDKKPNLCPPLPACCLLEPIMAVSPPSVNVSWSGACRGLLWIGWSRRAQARFSASGGFRGCCGQVDKTGLPNNLQITFRNGCFQLMPEMDVSNFMLQHTKIFAKLFWRIMGHPNKMSIGHLVKGSYLPSL